MQLRKNRVAIGAVAFVALLAATIWAVQTRDDASTDEAAELPSIVIDEETVTSLEITRPKGDGSEVVVLSKVDGEWRVSVPLEADADPNNVQSALNRLTEMTPKGVVATRPENYARLEVDDAKAVKVVVHSGEATPVQLRLGKYSNGVTMVRIGDRPEVFSVSGSVRFPFDRDLKTWRNRRVTDVQADTVQEIAFDSGNGSFRFRREQGFWVPAEKQRPIKNFDSKKVEGLVSTAARLTASDFAPSEVSAARAGLNEPDATITLRVATPVKEASDEADPAPAATEPVVIMLEIGDQTDKDTELYLRRNDGETIYVVSKYLADRLRPDAKALVKSEEAPPPTPPTPPMQGMPQGQQQPQLPPEVMKQLQEQIRQQQQQQQRQAR
jgi:hypothetical protein